MRQRGLWRATGVALTVLGLGFGVPVQAAHAETCVDEVETLVDNPWETAPRGSGTGGLCPDLLDVAAGECTPEHGSANRSWKTGDPEYHRWDESRLASEGETDLIWFVRGAGAVSSADGCAKGVRVDVRLEDRTAPVATNRQLVWKAHGSSESFDPEDLDYYDDTFHPAFYASQPLELRVRYLDANTSDGMAAVAEGDEQGPMKSCARHNATFRAEIRTSYLTQSGQWRLIDCMLLTSQVLFAPTSNVHFMPGYSETNCMPTATLTG